MLSVIYKGKVKDWLGMPITVHILEIRTDAEMIWWDGEDADSKMDGTQRVKGNGHMAIAIYDYPAVQRNITIRNSKGDSQTVKTT